MHIFLEVFDVIEVELNEDEIYEVSFNDQDEFGNEIILIFTTLY